MQERETTTRRGFFSGKKGIALPKKEPREPPSPPGPFFPFFCGSLSPPKKIPLGHDPIVSSALLSASLEKRIRGRGPITTTDVKKRTVLNPASSLLLRPFVFFDCFKSQEKKRGKESSLKIIGCKGDSGGGITHTRRPLTRMWTKEMRRGEKREEKSQKNTEGKRRRGAEFLTQGGRLRRRSLYHTVPSSPFLLCHHHILSSDGGVKDRTITSYYKWCNRAGGKEKKAKTKKNLTFYYCFYNCTTTTTHCSKS